WTYAIMAAVSAPLFFASIVIHELAHSMVAKFYKIPVKSITLFALGGVAHITRDATRPFAELLMALAGPLMSVVIGFVFFLTWVALGAQEERAVDFVLIGLGGMNVVLAVFNMIPLFPMDGGRVFRSLVWLVTGNYFRATSVAGWTGRVLAWGLMGAGALGMAGVDVYLANDTLSGFWLLAIGFFLENAARTSLVQNRLVAALNRYKTEELMVSDPPVVDSAISVGSLARGVIEINPRVCYFVEDQGKLAGILSAYQMRAVPEPLWDSTTAGEAMVPSAKLRATNPGQSVADVLMEMETENLTHMPVVTEGRVVGVIGRDRIIGMLQQSGLLA
ncbi:MAG: site-2 protease family protein, partial [Dehalococcoidia bacterium]